MNSDYYFVSGEEGQPEYIRYGKRPEQIAHENGALEFTGREIGFIESPFNILKGPKKGQPDWKKTAEWLAMEATNLHRTHDNMSQALGRMRVDLNNANARVGGLEQALVEYQRWLRSVDKWWLRWLLPAAARKELYRMRNRVML